MEAELIDWLAERLPPHRLLRLGVGDDAAVLDLALAPDCVVTVDMVNEGVDFRLGEIDARRAGHKALGVNLSDLAAMAARPLAVVIALALPREGALPLAQQLYEGMLPLAERFDVALAGGDTNIWDGPLAISITALGQITAQGPLRRAGARRGDKILVTGSFGGSILGRHLDVEPRIEEALLLHERYHLHAGMDVSDGLALDLSRLARASGCGAVLDLSAVPVAAAAVELAQQLRDGRSALDHALGDGEDFELLLAVPPDEAERLVREQPLGVPVTCIGEFVVEAGLWQHGAQGRRPLEPTGYQHG